MLLKNKKDFKVDSQLSHIAFIMDGNGRWAKKRGLPRKVGHKYGAEAFENTVRNCHKIGIKTVTVYAFSTENWSRPKEEIDAIIDLMRKNKIEPKEIQFVHSKTNEIAKLVLIKGVRLGKPYLKILEPLIVYDDSGEYTKQVLEYYGRK